MSSFLNFNESTMHSAKLAFPHMSHAPLTASDLGANVLACTIFILAVVFMSDNFSRRKSHQALYSPAASTLAAETKAVQMYECSSNDRRAAAPETVPAEKKKQEENNLSLFDSLALGAVMALRA